MTAISRFDLLFENERIVMRVRLSRHGFKAVPYRKHLTVEGGLRPGRRPSGRYPPADDDRQGVVLLDGAKCDEHFLHVCSPHFTAAVGSGLWLFAEELS